MSEYYPIHAAHKNKNWNCDGGNCRESNGEVRLYPLGGGANLILCRACWAHENLYRHMRNVEYAAKARLPSNYKVLGADGKELWPQMNWSEGKVYTNE